MATTAQFKSLKRQASQVITVDIAINGFLRSGQRSDNQSVNTITTRRCRLNQLSRYFASIGIEDITDINQLMLDEFLESYACDHAVSSTNTTKRVYKVFFEWVHDAYEIDLRVRPKAIHMARRPKSLPKALDIELVRKVIKGVENHQDRLMIAFKSEAGVRISELVDIRVEDVHYDEVLIRNGKNGDDRVVHITDSLASAIKVYLENNNHIYLFEHQAKGWYGKMTAGAARVRIQKAFMDVAGIHITPHQLRHTMAVEMLTNGCNIITVQDQLGHAYVTTTQIYLMLTNKQRKESYKTHMVSVI